LGRDPPKRYEKARARSLFLEENSQNSLPEKKKKQGNPVQVVRVFLGKVSHTSDETENSTPDVLLVEPAGTELGPACCPKCPPDLALPDIVGLWPDIWIDPCSDIGWRVCAERYR
jgi:hypothetical protein